MAATAQYQHSPHSLPVAYYPEDRVEPYSHSDFPTTPHRNNRTGAEDAYLNSPIFSPHSWTPKGRRGSHTLSELLCSPSNYLSLAARIPLPSSPAFSNYSPTPKRKRDLVDLSDLPSDVPSTPSRPSKHRRKTDVPATPTRSSKLRGKTDVPATPTRSSKLRGKTDVPATPTRSLKLRGKTDVPATPTRSLKLRGKTDVSTLLPKKEDEDDTITRLCRALYLRIVPDPKYPENPEVDEDHYPTLLELSKGIERESITSDEAAKFRKELLEEEYVVPTLGYENQPVPDFEDSDFDEWDLYSEDYSSDGEGTMDDEGTHLVDRALFISNADAGLDWH
ncbi:hypothetical protein BJ508DRAFT_376309 [Ascobolus immersus RN42]|uniref:Uncharacterized protein n=1 Tax=Ascobolus immersus RN42 TaxID=1160509 RepID=A0A3N4IBH1_ASCIM|nr:hypothetical protein BJ508DRAFT_376309 [Ascobolus immersus RN42]